MSNLAIILARAGSKRLPGKNIKNFLGKPIISYPIMAAIRSGIFDEIMVSTDSDEIAGIAKSYGAKVLFPRSANTSDDQSTTAEVISEVLSEYSKLGQTYTQVGCLYATSVFVTPELLNQAQTIITKEETDGVVTVTPYNHPIQRALSVKNNHLSFNDPDLINTRTQDLEISYHDAAQLYFLKTMAFENEHTVFLKNSMPIILSPTTVQDIDTSVDWQLAELKYQNTMEVAL